MIKELYKEVIVQTALNISQSRIEAVMKKNITKSGCRVYHNGFIGVAGNLGEPKNSTWAKAEKNLAKKISYPFEPETNKQRSRDLRSLTLNEQEFLVLTEEILGILRREYPQFIFSNKIRLLESTVTLSNNAGLDYANHDRSIEIGLLVKHVDSISIFDTAILYQSRSLDKDTILKEARQMLDAYLQPAVLPQQEKMPVILHPAGLMGKIIESLNGEHIGLGTSLFSGKIGLKAFSPELTVCQDRTEEKYHVPFYDSEGVVSFDDQSILIDQGTISRPYTDKKQASVFNYTLTGSAGGGYDDVPSLGYADLSITPSGKTLQNLLQGEKGIMVIMASGGDYSPEGNFASPVQMACLTDGKQLLGRLPELNISGNLYELFGQDFIGVSVDKPLAGERALAVRMNINKS